MEPFLARQNEELRECRATQISLQTVWLKIEDPQVCLRILRSCLGFCKIVYTMRTVPWEMHADQLVAYDEVIRSTFSTCTGISPNDSQWEQATRGFECAGLGLRSASFHAAAAYLASCAATAKACAEVDSEFRWDPEDASRPPPRPAKLL